jgi:tRNA-2-methylthio-N6-dimethylallyladenosine synthase
LQALLWRQQLTFNRQSVGTVTEVLFDGHGKVPGQLMGRTRHMQSFYLEGDASLYGTVQQVRIEAGHQSSVSGILALPLSQAS